MNPAILDPTHLPLNLPEILKGFKICRQTDTGLTGTIYRAPIRTDTVNCSCNQNITCNPHFVPWQVVFQRIHKSGCRPIQLERLEHMKDLGVIFDSELNFVAAQRELAQDVVKTYVLL